MNMLSLVSDQAANDESVETTFFEAHGSHGTCCSRAASILEHGFRVGGGGRRGVGAYLWHAAEQGCQYATQLAEMWFAAAEKRGEYSDEADKGCAVLWGYVKAPDEEVLNLESPEFRVTLRKALDGFWSTINSQDADERENLICAVHQMLISRTEDTKGIPVGVVLATVQQPPRMPDQLAGYVGAPFAVIVRNLDYLAITKN
ncbi:hypothetical protein ACP7HA_003005 [Klebsiella pneumoniae]|uniref:hypothetical protein n=1 Tax=Klebsiella pneumoniae complex TaxID=3390273 RepID=UPI0011E6C802|nr:MULTISPECIES: hypothetical protein [Klebsiella]EIX9167113.1 hypothetical protein [Klebsiella pneumoniae]EKZ5519250.1 hypothetical protein [Klebsiella pneumoniae]EKZ5528245.1 hypothetical protein [Klebsiella pneumoniae]ELB7278757.1 hypothetical protein [Klebsiella pneumoniae]ELN5387763.1 hypothetical protein [Klebsiella pneumoniae]